MMRPSKLPDEILNFKYTSFPSFKVLIPLLIFTVFGVAFTEADLFNTKLFLSWLIVGAIVTTAITGLLYLLKIIFEKRYGHEIPVVMVIVVGGLIGALKGGSTEFFVNLVAIKDSYPWDEIAIRAFSGIFLGIGFAFALGLKATYLRSTLESYDKFHEDNQKLAAEIATLGREIELLKDLTKERFLDKVVQNLNPMTTLDVLASDPEKNWNKISTALRIGLTNRVRNESYSLIFQEDKPLSIGKQIQKVFLLRKVNLHPKVLALLHFITGVSITYVDWNPTNTALQLLFNTFVSFIVSTLFRTLLRNHANPSRSFNLAIISGVIFVNGSLYALVGVILWSKFDIFFQISLFFWHTFLLLTISSVSEIIQYMSAQKEIRVSVHDDLLEKKRVLVNHLEELSQEYSKHLHGFLIMKIHTTATLLDVYAQNGDFGAYKEELSNLLGEFTIEGLKASLSRDVIDSEYFSQLQVSWSSLIHVSINSPENLIRTVKNPQRIEIAHVIEELVSNAYRHGAATAIRIEIRWLNDTTFEIFALDNGAGATMPVKWGLGSKTFNSASDGNWSIRDIPYQGVAVKLEITLYEPASDVGPTPAERAASDQPEGRSP